MIQIRLQEAKIVRSNCLFADYLLRALTPVPLETLGQLDDYIGGQ